jgi:hypothetical protein
MKMCTFISVALPNSADAALCRSVFAEHKLGLKSVTRRGIPKGVLAHENYYFTVTHHCDCGTALGAAVVYQDGERRARRHEDRKLRTLRKKGWSEAKIDRRRKDMGKTVDKYQRTMDARSEHAGDEIANWITLIDRLLGQRVTPWIGVTVNEYSGDLDNPGFDLKRRKLSRSLLTPADLEGLAPATLLVVS